MSNSEVQLDRARLLLDQGRVNDAIKEVKNVLQQEPENDSALSVYARCLYDKHEFDKGIEVILNAIRIDPENGFYFYLLGFGYYRKDNNTIAIDNLYKAILLDPYHAEYYGLLAFIYLEDKNFETALLKADEGLAIDPENITCLNARSTALNKLRRTDDAIETMQNTLSKDPDNEFTHATVGWNFLEKGKHKQATKHFREALRIAPDHRNAKAGLKEALKSKIPPYRWLLQFSFWMNNKGKNFRWTFLILIFVGVRVIVSASKNDQGMSTIGIIVGGCYFLFVATSWIIGPLANVFLLFHKDGKHALENSERWNAIAFMICVFSGIALMTASSFTTGKERTGQLIAAGFVALSLCVPAGHMRFPLRLKGNSFSQWMAIALIIVAIVSVITALAGSVSSFVFFVVYFVFFVLYTWTS
jgi:tetratricopeptide (TPR) repeat protein